MSALLNSLGTLTEDVRFGCRMIGRNPLVTCAVVLTLSVGIGIATGVFSLLNAFAFRSPVSLDPDSFVSGGNNYLTFSEYVALRDQTQSLRELAAWSEMPNYAPIGEGPAPVGGMLVSCNFFSVFVETASRGRLIEPADCQSSQPVMLISEKLWRNRFAADPAIVGTRVSYGDRPVTIIGVLKSVSMGVRYDVGQRRDAWFPYTMQPYLKDTLAFSSLRKDLLNTSDSHTWLQFAGRLQPGYSREAAEAELRLIASGEDRLNRLRNTPDSDAPLTLTNGSAWSIGDLPTPDVFLMLVLPTTVMLIASVSVAMLLLSRAAGRRREMATRLALGGSRMRLVRMLFIESLLLATVSAVVSLALIYWIPPVLLRFLTADPPSYALSPDWRVLTFLAMTTIPVAVCLCSGLTPALESLNLQLSESLKGRRILGRRRGASRMRGLLVGIQMVFSTAPLVGAVLFVRAEHRFANPGFETRQVVFARLSEKQSFGKTPLFFAEAIQGLPSVKSVGYSNTLPGVLELVLHIESPDPSLRTIPTASVSPSYFAVLGIPIVVGRSFSEEDSGRSADVKPIVVSRKFAHRFFANSSPLGRIVEEMDTAARMEIVGVAEDRALGEVPFRPVVEDGSFIYQLADPSRADNYMLARFEGEPGASAPAIQSALRRAAGSDIVVSTIQSMIDLKMAPVRRIKILLGILGGIALALAASGIFGIVSFSAEQRRKEVAIRLAVGAQRLDIFQTIVLSGLRPIGIGMAAGLLLTWGMLKIAVAQMSIPVNIQDPVPYFAVPALLLVIVIIAMLAPAYRAASSNPVDALREE